MRLHLATQTGATLHYLAAAAARLPGGSHGLLDRLHGRFPGLEVVQLGQPPQRQRTAWRACDARA